MSEETPAHVAAKATIEDALSLRGLTLLGVMKAHDGPAALLRSSRGRIARVAPGGRAFGVTVAAIADDHVVLSYRDGSTTTLGIPGRS